VSQRKQRTFRLETPERAGAKLCVEFYWADDRWAHRIVATAGEQSLALLTSCEDDSATHWPESPALQELEPSAEATEKTVGDCCFLMGATSSAHWSVSATAQNREQAPGITFDVACRVKEPPQWLGSSYRLGEGRLQQLDGSTAKVSTDLGEFRIVALPLTDDSTIPSCELHIDGNQLKFRCNTNSGAQLPSTHRWQYRVEMM
jgi:hypothetical protein